MSGPQIALEVLEVAALVYLMWVIGEVAAKLRDHLGDHTKSAIGPVPGCTACDRATGGVCWEHRVCRDCRAQGPNGLCPKHG